MGGCFKPISLKPYNHIWLIIIINPHLSSWGNARTRTTFPTRGSRWVHYIGRVGGACQACIIWNLFLCSNKKPTPSNAIGSMMVIRVLPIHVPPCYVFHHTIRGGYLSPIPLKPCITYDDHLVWSIHVPRRYEPLITLYLSLWGNARIRARFPTHKKNHNPHPQGGGGKGGQNRYITLWWGGGGGLPNLDYIFKYIYKIFK